MSKEKSPDATSGPFQSHNADDSTTRSADAIPHFTREQLLQMGSNHHAVRALLRYATDLKAPERRALEAFLQGATWSTYTDCYQSVATIAERLGTSDRTVQRQQKRLSAKGYITIERRSGRTNNVAVTLEKFIELSERATQAATQKKAATCHGRGDKLSGVRDKLSPQGRQIDGEGVTKCHPTVSLTTFTTEVAHDVSLPARAREDDKAYEGTIENRRSPETRSEASANPVVPAVSESDPRADLLTQSKAPIPPFWADEQRATVEGATSLEASRTPQKFSRADADARKPEHTCKNCGTTWKAWNADDLCPQMCRPLRNLEGKRQRIMTARQR